MRDTDTVARIGGDEFVLLIEGMTRPDEVTSFYNRLRDSLSAPLTVAGVSVRMGASIGVVLDPDSHADPDDILRDADAAMYEAKEQGRNRAVIFDDHERPAVMGRLVTAGELARASSSAQFELHYQPVVNLNTGRSAGCEALLRWHHPTRGLLAPGAFLEAAEASDEIITMSEWAFDAAVRQVAQWETANDLTYYRVGVNFAPRQFTQSDVVSMVRRVLNRHGVNGDRMVVEITETAMLSTVDMIEHDLVRLRDLGVGIHVDDFGTGFSSISMLRELPVTGLKLDLSFVRNLTAGESPSNALAKGLAGLAEGLHLMSVAEGIESEEQAAILTCQGWTHGQGYLFGRPQPL